MNFLQVGLISLLRVALNIMTCLVRGVERKTSWTSRLMSVIEAAKVSFLFNNASDRRPRPEDGEGM